MATTFSATATVTARIQATHTRTDEIAPTRDVVDLNIPIPFDDVDLIMPLRLNETQLVSLVSFVDAFGRDVGFSEIRAIFIHNKATGPLDAITIGEVNDFSGVQAGTVIPPGGVFLVTSDGWLVDAEGSLLIEGDGEVLYDIVVVGTAAA
jgi:hypothetical protein